MAELEGKVALITGASRGIGEATARLFAEKGAKVVLVARGAKDISRIAAEIGPNAKAVTCDVSQYSQVSAAIDEAVEGFGGLDILINNAGVIEPISMMEDSDPETWGHAVDINLKGVYYGMRAALPHMLEKGAGTIITVSSGAAHNPLEAWSHYCAGKAGAAMLTRSLDLETRARGIRAMGLSPGTVATQMQKEIKASGINKVSELEWTDHVPAEWPAKALLWMATPASDDYLGLEISLREPVIRKRLGLTG